MMLYASKQIKLDGTEDRCCRCIVQMLDGR